MAVKTNHLCLFLLFHQIVWNKSAQDLSETEIVFKDYVKKYNKSYSVGDNEYNRRFRIFKENLKNADDLNANRTHNSSAKYGITVFTDLTKEEFAARYLSSYNSTTHVSYASHLLRTSASSKPDYPPAFDWRDAKIITPVKDQKACGGCWAFSTVQTLESMQAKKMGKLEALSVQEVIDCSYNSYGLYGCLGGDTCRAMEWLQKTQYPVKSEKQYPIADKSQTCRMFPQNTSGVLLASYTCNKYANEYEMVRLLAKHGPLTVAIDATNWANYQGGVIQYHCSEFYTNHAVQLVGYNTKAEVPYFIAKNSWGKNFGHNGYVYIKIEGNVCGIANEVSALDVS